MTERPSHVGVSAGHSETHAELRSQLEELRRDRLDQLDQLSEVLVGEDDLTAPRVATLRHVLAEIDAALERMEDGSYGVCGKCATPIPEERLEIMPYTRYCVTCQQRSA